MHPIERLRWVARAPDGEVSLVVGEAASALASFADDHAGLVIACRRLIERRPECGPLWWLAARMLCALDPATEAYRAADDLERDPTSAVLAAILPDTALVLLEAHALGPPGFVAARGSGGLARAARKAGRPVWLVAGVGRTLPGPLYDALVGRLDSRSEILPLDAVDEVVTERGLVAPAVAARRARCPLAPELLHFPG
jgi:hypothetical protein